MAFSGLKDRILHWLHAPPEQLGRGTRWARDQFDLWRFSVLRLKEVNATALGAALSFRTIFAIIPVLVLAFLVLKSVGVLGDAQNSLRYVLEYTGLQQIYLRDRRPGETEPTDEPPGQAPQGPPPAAGVENVALRLEAAIAQAEQQLTLGRLGPIGAVLLIWTSLTLLTTIERSLNRIFEAERSRSIGHRSLLYWSAMTLGPVAVVATVFAIGQATDYATDHVPGAVWVMNALDWAVPGLVGVVLLAALYKLMPNTQVGFWPAVGGAVFVVPIWMVAKWGFALYVKSLVAKGHLYGTLGVIPLFLLWLYMSWLVFLLGAQLAHTAAHLRRFQAAESASKVFLGPWDFLAAALAVARGFQAGQGPVSAARVAEDLRMPTPLVEPLLAHLASAGVVCPVGTPPETGYVPSRPLEQISVLDAIDLAQGHPARQVAVLGPGGAAPAHAYAPAITEGVGKVQRQARSALGAVTFAQVLAAEG